MKNEEVQKEQWQKPVLTKMEVANVTKNGSFVYQIEDPYNHFYGPS